MESIIIVQTVLPHYRKSFFELICLSQDYDISVVSGKDETIAKSFNLTNNNILDQLINKKHKIASHTFIFQKGLFRFILNKKPDHVVFGGPDIHVISSLLIAIYLRLFTKTKIHWWTHGLSIKNKWLRRIQAFFLSFSRSAIVYETEGKKNIVEHLQWNTQRISVLKNSINTRDYGFNRLPCIEKAYTQNDPLKILFSGRMTTNKRCDILIKAIAILNNKGMNCIVNIVGKGESYDDCVALVSQLNINDKVNFLGELYEDEVHGIFCESDLFVLPGKVGLSVVHALSYGLPVITTREPIHSPEIAIIEEGKNGSFFIGLSPENLATEIVEWFILVKTHPKEIKISIMESVVQSGYTPESMSENFLNHFKYLN